jgi:hypothetical protein
MISSAEPHFSMKRKSSLNEIDTCDALDDISMPSGDAFNNSPLVDETSPVNDGRGIKLYVEHEDSEMEEDDSDEEQDQMMDSPGVSA